MALNNFKGHESDDDYFDEDDNVTKKNPIDLKKICKISFSQIFWIKKNMNYLKFETDMEELRAKSKPISKKASLNEEIRKQIENLQNGVQVEEKVDLDEDDDDDEKKDKVSDQISKNKNYEEEDVDDDEDEDQIGPSIEFSNSEVVWISLVNLVMIQVNNLRIFEGCWLKFSYHQWSRVETRLKNSVLNHTGLEWSSRRNWRIRFRC